MPRSFRTRGIFYNTRLIQLEPWSQEEKEGRVISWAMHFQCAVGGCRFFEYVVDETDEVVKLPGGRLDGGKVIEMGL